MLHSSLMPAADAGLLVVDMQDSLLRLIPGFQSIVRNVAFLIDAARIFRIPIEATEQYPKGLGCTTRELTSRLPERKDKVAFSCCAIPSLTEAFRSADRTRVVVVGIETHVCVLHTGLDLLASGFQVYIPADAVASRNAIDHDFALRRLERAGAVIVTSETVAFEWAGTAGTPEFKQISRLMQERMQRLTSLEA